MNDVTAMNAFRSGFQEQNNKQRSSCVYKYNKWSAKLGAQTTEGTRLFK